MAAHHRLPAATRMPCTIFALPACLPVQQPPAWLHCRPLPSGSRHACHYRATAPYNLPATPAFYRAAYLHAIPAPHTAFHPCYLPCACALSIIPPGTCIPTCFLTFFFSVLFTCPYHLYTHHTLSPLLPSTSFPPYLPPRLLAPFPLPSSLLPTLPTCHSLLPSFLLMPTPFLPPSYYLLSPTYYLPPFWDSPSLSGT